MPGWTGGGAAAVTPMVGRAALAVADAGRLLASAHDVEWVSDAAALYRSALDEAQQQVLRAQTLVEQAQRATLALDRAVAAAAHTRAAARAGSGLLGVGP